MKRNKKASSIMVVSEDTVLSQVSSMKTQISKFARSKQTDKETIYSLSTELQELREQVVTTRKKQLNIQRDV